MTRGEIRSSATLFSFDEESEEVKVDPKEYVSYVEANFILDRDHKKLVELIRTGTKADKTFVRKKHDIAPGDYITRPYSEHLMHTLRKSVERGRIVRRGSK